MIFKENRGRIAKKVGEKIGYVFAYFLFTTILFFILTFLDKIPESWNYTNIMLITFTIALIGVVIKILLK